MRSAPKRFRFSIGKIILILIFLFVIAGRCLEPLGNKQSKLVHTVLRPLFSFSNIIWNPIEGLWHRYFYLVGLHSENIALKKENSELLQKLMESQSQNVSFEHFQALKEAYNKSSYHPKLAQVIAYDPMDPSLGIWINQGSEESIGVGQIVMAQEGLVGIISKVFSHTAKIIPLISPNSALDVEIVSSGVRGILKGEGKYLGMDRKFWTTRMEYMGNTEKIEEGDRVSTSGLDKIFAKGLLVGKIHGLKKNEQGMFVSAEVLPEVDFSKLRDVSVLIP